MSQINLKSLPRGAVPVEPRWQPEQFLLLPGFLDKNNDLLFRNLKEVSVGRGCFQSSAEQGVGFKTGAAPGGKGSAGLYLHPRGSSLKRQTKVPKVNSIIKKPKENKPPDKPLCPVFDSL